MAQQRGCSVRRGVILWLVTPPMQQDEDVDSELYIYVWSGASTCKCTAPNRPSTLTMDTPSHTTGCLLRRCFRPALCRRMTRRSVRNTRRRQRQRGRSRASSLDILAGVNREKARQIQRVSATGARPQTFSEVRQIREDTRCCQQDRTVDAEGREIQGGTNQ